MSTTERRIGRYLLRHPVGRGAMGIVYRAEDPLIHRTVAVKVLHTATGLTPQQVGIARERFRREAQAAGSIDHPNIIRILDVGEEDEGGEMYIVMEYLPGPSLEEMINEAELGLTRAVEIIGQLASGLDAAHARGIVHRDIKPSNILFTENGTAKLADFGITQVASSALTQDMTKLGTPAYMSPEQVNGRILDPKADLFSLGVLSYEILTGRKPFAGADVVSIAYAIAHAQPDPVSAANPQLPHALDPVLERMLAKEPGDRFGSGREFHEALLRGLRAGAVGRQAPTTKAPKRRVQALWGIAGVAALAAVIFLVSPKADRSSAPDVAKAPEQAAIKPAAPVRVPVPTTQVTIRLTHRIRRGTLIVTVDGAPILTEEFSKARLAISKTSTWGPVRVPVGRHKVRAKVKGENGKTYLSDSYAIELPRGKQVELSVRLKGDEVSVQQSSTPAQGKPVSKDPNSG